VRPPAVRDEEPKIPRSKSEGQDSGKKNMPGQPRMGKNYEETAIAQAELIEQRGEKKET